MSSSPAPFLSLVSPPLAHRHTVQLHLWRPRVNFRTSILALLLGGFFSGLWFSRLQVQREMEFYSGLSQIKVIAPEFQPEPSQENIDLALAIYGIQVPDQVDAPEYQPSLKDRGLTTRGIWLKETHVTIGPSAFSSWSLLGSTLAHEVEVHCAQNFLMIYLMDTIGLEGTIEAERQAYMHELKSASRMGLGKADERLIADTMEYFYPVNKPQAPRERLVTSVRQWLARSLR